MGDMHYEKYLKLGKSLKNFVTLEQILLRYYNLDFTAPQRSNDYRYSLHDLLASESSTVTLNLDFNEQIKTIWTNHPSPSAESLFERGILQLITNWKITYALLENVSKSCLQTLKAHQASSRHHGSDLSCWDIAMTQSRFLDRWGDGFLIKPAVNKNSKSLYHQKIIVLALFLLLNDVAQTTFSDYPGCIYRYE